MITLYRNHITFFLVIKSENCVAMMPKLRHKS